jgi:hypothetical protein
MNMSTKREVLRANLKKWLATEPYSAERRELTAQLTKTLQIHPRSLGRAMKREQLRRTEHTTNAGRPRMYGPEVRAALRVLYDETEGPCAENMAPEIDTYIYWLVVENRWDFSDETEALVKGISIGTLKKFIAKFREKDGTLRGKSSTTPSELHTLIPVRKSHTWPGLGPGHLQLDTVVHCGDVLTDDVVYSVGGVDFATYWAEYTGQWNKGEEETQKSANTIQGRFPFTSKEIHPDSGNEFINHHFFRWSREEEISMTRSEPYKKNDNMCIEERNSTIPRRHLGYVRIDDPVLVPLLSEILRIACLIHNHFRPVRRMTAKWMENSKWRRKYEKVAKTPFQRVMESKQISKKDKEALQKEHDRLNPLELRRELDRLKKQLADKLRD